MDEDLGTHWAEFLDALRVNGVVGWIGLLVYRLEITAFNACVDGKNETATQPSAALNSMPL